MTLDVDRAVLTLLYAAPPPTQIVAAIGDEAAALLALERLRRDRLIELLGPAGGPYSYRLSPAARACLNAVGNMAARSKCGRGLAMRGHGWIVCVKEHGHDGECAA